MTDYRHNRVPGGTFFFTVRLLERGSTLLTDHFSAFGEAMRQARIKRPFHVDAWVVLPDHAHAIWTLPPGDRDCASRWRAVKIAFSKALRKSSAGHDRIIWERSYQHHRIADDAEYDGLINYDTKSAAPRPVCAGGRVAVVLAAPLPGARISKKRARPGSFLYLMRDTGRKSRPAHAVIRMRTSRQP